MLDCLLIGDELAIGLSKYRPECSVVAKPQINSEVWVEQNIGNLQNSKITIISLTAHDTPDVYSQWNLETIRSKIKTGRVFWIVPSKTKSSLNIDLMLKYIAKKYKDTLIYSTDLNDIAERTK